MGAGVRRQPGADQEHHEAAAGPDPHGDQTPLRHPARQAQHVRPGRQPPDRGRHQLAARPGGRTAHVPDPQRDPELELVERRTRHGRRALRQRGEKRRRREREDARHLQRLPGRRGQRRAEGARGVGGHAGRPRQPRQGAQAEIHGLRAALRFHRSRPGHPHDRGIDPQGHRRRARRQRLAVHATHPQGDHQPEEPRQRIPAQMVQPMPGPRGRVRDQPGMGRQRTPNSNSGTARPSSCSSTAP